MLSHEVRTELAKQAATDAEKLTLADTSFAVLEYARYQVKVMVWPYDRTIVMLTIDEMNRAGIPATPSTFSDN
jgi:hypothetical protein